MNDMVHLVVAYDVSDDRRRLRLHKLLRGHLWPCEESVFIGNLPAEEWVKAKTKALKLMREEDRLLIITLCRRCWSHIERYRTLDADVEAGIRWLSVLSKDEIERQITVERVAKNKGEA